MSSCSILLARVQVFLARIIIPTLAISTALATPRVIVKVQDTTVVMGNPVALNIYLDNPADYIAGFQIMLSMNRPDIAKFDFSGMGCDTTGTLASGSELIAVSDPSGVGTSIKVTCLRNDLFIPPNTPPIAPQTGGIAVKVIIKTFPPPFPSGDDTLSIYIQENYTSFSDPLGNSIGVFVEDVIDTIGFKCLSWSGSTCLAWERCLDYHLCTDSLRIDTVQFAHLDTNQVALRSGKLAIPLLNCDNNGTATVNILDLVCVVKYLFGGFNTSLCPTFHCDANASGTVNILDVTYLVRYLFKGGPPPSGNG